MQLVRGSNEILLGLQGGRVATADRGGGGGEFFNVQTIFKHVSMCMCNLLGACFDASAAVQRLCPYIICHVHV